MVWGQRATPKWKWEAQGGTMEGAGLRQTKPEGGWTVRKTQEDEEKKMAGWRGAKTDGKGWLKRKGRH